MTKRIRIGMAVLTAFVLLFGGSLVGMTTAAGAETKAYYYLCLESSEYRVNATEMLKESGGEFRIDRRLDAGERLMISDGAGKLWGDRNGRPLKVTESARYTVKFRPEMPYENGGYVLTEFYSPAAVTLDREGEDVAFDFNAFRSDYDEYTVTEVTLSAGETVAATDGTTWYGETETGDSKEAVDAIVVPRAGTYRFVFTTDPDYLYGEDRDRYLDWAEVPEIFLHRGGTEIRMTRNERQILYEEYSSTIETTEREETVTYSVENRTEGKTDLPSESGSVTVKDKGEWQVRWSPTHLYTVRDGKGYRTALEWADQNYDGWYLLGDFNDWTVLEHEDFDAAYAFVKSEDATLAYDEYRLEFTVTEEMLAACGGKVAYMISDGNDRIRKPNGDDAVFAKAGTYEILFSPTHDYGRGYRYRVTKIGTDPAVREVRIGTADEWIAELAKCADGDYSVNTVFTLTADLDLTGKTVPVVPVFSGTTDGCYHTIRGLHIESDGDGAALFRQIETDGKLMRIRFEAVTIAAKGSYAGIVGRNYGTVSDLTVKGELRADRYVGAVAYQAKGGTIERCVSEASVFGIVNAGGIAGFNAGEIRDCENRGRINDTVAASSDAAGMLNVGGIAGYSTGKIIGARNTGKVGRMSQGHYVGGIVGLCGGETYFADNSGRVEGDRYVGGVVGYFGRIEQQSNELSDLLAGTEYADWLDKYFGSGDDFEEAEDQGTHRGSYLVNGGEATGETIVGGIAGHVGTPELKNSFSDGIVRARGKIAGGIAGSLDGGTILSCGSAGSVESTKDGFVGGIVGTANGSVKACFSTALVTAHGDYAGGIAGKGTSVEQCYADVLIVADGADHTGAIAGFAGSGDVSRVGSFRYNYFVGTAGIDGAAYGQAFDYAAAAIDREDLISEGALGAALVGFDSEYWIGGAKEKTYPALRAFDECVAEDGYPEFDERFEATVPAWRARTDLAGTTRVTVAFYAWNFDTEKYEFLSLIRVPYSGDVEASQIPQAPSEEGWLVEWEDFDRIGLTESAAVYERAVRIVNTVTAGDSESHPTAIVEGAFREGTEAAIRTYGDYREIVLTEEGRTVSYRDCLVRVRIGEGTYRLSVDDGDGGTERAFEVSDGYAVFRLSAGERYALTRVESPDWLAFAAYVASGVAFGTLLGVGAWMLFAKKRRNLPLK